MKRVLARLGFLGDDGTIVFAAYLKAVAPYSFDQSRLRASAWLHDIFSPLAIAAEAELDRKVERARVEKLKARAAKHKEQVAKAPERVTKPLPNRGRGGVKSQ